MDVQQPLTPGSGIDPPFKPEDVARAEIRRFIQRFDPRHDGIPKRIEPAFAEHVLREELATTKLARWPASRFADLADFYDARGVVPDLVKLLDGSEQTAEDVARSATFVAAVGVLGGAEARALARAYYHRLLSHPKAEERMPALVDCYAVLAPEETPALTVGRIDEMIAGLDARAASDPSARTAALALEDLRHGPLARADAAAALEREILATPEPAARLDRLADIYLDIDMRYYEFMRRWAVRVLLREARAGGAQGIAVAFRRALDRIAAGPKDVRQPRASRALRAIEFFGGPISKDERAALDPPMRLFDLLSND